MPKNVLVTGGAGFIGSHLVDALLERGYRVRVLDCLDPQVHGEVPEGGAGVNIADHVCEGRVEFIRGDVQDAEVVDRALQGQQVVYHEAAAVGVGQSMYEIVQYTAANSLGAARLLESIVRGGHAIERMVVASSMSIYGEGRYVCPACGPVEPPLRSDAQMEEGRWEMECDRCGTVAEPGPTDENKRLAPTSVYAVTKRDHEELFLSVGAAYGIPTVALRYFNVYGPRQSLNNPYTGVGAIFSSRLIAGNAPLVFEDGLQSRDFIHVSDIVAANILALENDAAAGHVFNVGTGRRMSLMELVAALRDKLGGPEPEVVGRFRKGDIRHCYADVTRARDILGFEAAVRFEDGVDDLVAWAREQEVDDQVDRAVAELEAAKLTL